MLIFGQPSADQSIVNVFSCVPSKNAIISIEKERAEDGGTRSRLYRQLTNSSLFIVSNSG